VDDGTSGGSGWARSLVAVRDLPPATVVLASLTAVCLLLVVLLLVAPAPQTSAGEGSVTTSGDIRGGIDIRVRVVRRAVGITLVSDGDTIEMSEQGSDETWVLRSPVELSAREASLRFTGSEGVEFTSPGPVVLADGRYQLGGINVVGVLEARVAIGEDALVDVIAELPLERYLPGVLAGEMLSGWPLEAFKAQAVAARSFALHERQFSRARGRAWDVERTTVSQAYVGETSLGVAIEAAQSTRARVLAWEGDVLRAYYCSTVGGRAAGASDTFRTDDGYAFNLAPPLQASERAYFSEDSPTDRWERERRVSSLSARFRAWGASRGHEAAELGRLTRIEAVGFNEVGRPTRFEVEDRDGRVVSMSAEDVRVACNRGVEGLPAIGFSRRVLSGDATFTFRRDRVTISGRGFGHGVGLCQYSAAALAQQGEDYLDILSRYYPGADLVRVDDVLD